MEASECVATPRRTRRAASPPDPLLMELQTLRGVLFGDRYHERGALRDLQDSLNALRNDVHGLRADVDAQGESIRLGQLRWRWILTGGSVVGALVGSGVITALERLVG